MSSSPNTRTPSTASTIRSAPNPARAGRERPVGARMRDPRGRGRRAGQRATKASFTYKDECVRLGPLVGHDAEATQAATVAVTGFLKSVLKP